MEARLKTARLHLRPLQPDDIDRIATLLAERDVSRWLSSVPYPYRRSDAAAYLSRDAGRRGVWGIEYGTLAGAISLLAGRGLGFWHGRAYWGQGLMSEAVAAVLRARFRASNLPVISGHHPDNRASRRILTKMGFRDTDLIDVPASGGGRSPVQRMQLTARAWAAASDGKVA